jgi:dTDP-glucose 4,6-dehydratase
MNGCSVTRDNPLGGRALDTVLVTGGAGFLGSWFVEHLLAEEPTRRGGCPQVVVLDKLTYAGSLASLSSVRDQERFVFRWGDIGDATLVAALLREFHPQAIVNFAAESHVDRSIDAPAPFVSTNVVGTWQLLETACDYWRLLPAGERLSFRFLHVSTDEVFGPIAAGQAATEHSAYRPSSPYAASKAAADHFVRAYDRTYGLPTIVVHPSNCYGPRQFPEKLVPLVILNALDGLSVPVYGDGLQRRDWLHAEDLCRAVRLALRQAAPGESLTVAGGAERTNLELVGEICRLVDRLVPGLPHAPSASLMTHVEDRPGHDARYAMDATQIRRLGWRPQVELSAGLEQTVRWYVDHRDWVDEVAAQFDRSRRLGLPLTAASRQSSVESSRGRSCRPAGP